jgi:hypothetical protein
MNDDTDTSSQGCSSEQRLAAAGILKDLLREEELGEDQNPESSPIRKPLFSTVCLICSALMIHYSPTFRIESVRDLQIQILTILLIHNTPLP